MERFLAIVLQTAIPLFAVGSMLSVGFRYPVREVLGPLRDIPGIVSAVVANFLAVPLLAFGIARLLSLDEPTAIGLILVASAAGAPFLVKLTQFAKDDVAFAAAILVLLVVVTILYMPLVVPLLAQGAPVSATAIAMPLVLTMLVPLGIGFATRAVLPSVAQRLLPFVGIVTNVAMIAMVAATVLANLEAILGVFGTGAIFAAALLIGGAFAIGYLVGTFDPAEKSVLGLATAQRNFAAATVVATQSFEDPGVLVMVVVVSTIAMALLLPLSKALGRRAGDAGCVVAD